MPEIVFNIRTSADLAAAKDAKSALEDSIKVVKAGSPEAEALNKQLEAVNVALTSEAAAAVRAAEGLERLIAAKKKLKQDTTAEESALGDIKGTLEHANASDDDWVQKQLKASSELKKYVKDLEGGEKGAEK